MRWLLAFASCLVGCYSPQPHAGSPCPDGVCPDGLVCSPATVTCERTAIDAGPHDGPPRDVALDVPLDAVTVIDAPPAISPQLVQQKGRERTASASLDVTLDAAPTTGNLLVVIGGAVSGQLDAVSGGGVASWTRAAFSPISANCEIWFGATNGSSSTVTISLPSSTSSMTMLVTEWSHVAAMLDGATVNAIAGSPASAGSITTTNAHDLLLFAIANFTPNTNGSLAGYTPLTTLPGTQTGVQQAAWYREVTTTGTYAPSITITNNEWDACLVALKVAP